MELSGYRVLKFGGSSVANATVISRVVDIVSSEAPRGRLIVISSAISGCTDALIGGDGEALQAIRERHHAIIRRLFTGVERAEALAEFEEEFQRMTDAPRSEKVTFGELFSTRILARKFACEGYSTRWLDSRRLVVKGDRDETYRRIAEAVRSGDEEIFVAPGFIASDPSGKVTDLGRGGSDYSAALYAAAVGAVSLEIWTDVPGIMTTNPKNVSAARTVPRMSYRAALDMATHGAKVLYAPTVAPARDAGIDIAILNTYAPEAGGTVVSGEASAPGWIGIADRELSGGTVRIAIIGAGENDLPGAAERALDILKRTGIEALSTRPEGPNLLIDVQAAVARTAIRALHGEFFETLPLRTLPLYIAGYGAVGKALVELLGRSAAAVAEQMGRKLILCGIADSRRYLIDPEGIAPEDAAAALEERSVPGDFTEAVLASAPRRSVFVDCTDSETLHERYEDLLDRGINIASSNRRSFAVPFVQYAAMHRAARRNGVFLRYETTVGAALPILDSISRSANSCDEITSIDAVVSCTLNRIFGDYGTGASFASLVRKAHIEGLTEPDPRVDLGGEDALRKLLILARQAGVPLEREDVQVFPIIGKDLSGLTLEGFFRALEDMENRFSDSFKSAVSKGKRKRFVASLRKENGRYKAWIKLQDVDEKHPAYHLRGTENAIIIRSAFHPYPLVIAGAGEGARQAASSLLNDILS